jgi:hypothetical protein
VQARENNRLHHIIPLLRSLVSDNIRVGFWVSVDIGCQGRVAKMDAAIRCGVAGCSKWKASTSFKQLVKLWTGSQLLWPELYPFHLMRYWN